MTDQTEQPKPRRRISNPLALLWAALSALTDNVAGPAVTLTPATEPDMSAALARSSVFEAPAPPMNPSPPLVPAAYSAADMRRRTMGWRTDIQRPADEDEARRARQKREKAARRQQRQQRRQRGQR